MKKIQLILLFLLAVSASARELTWDDALAEAKKNNPALKKSAEALRQADLSYSSAYSNFLPNLSASAGASQSKSDDSDLQRNYSVGLSGSLSLFSGFGDYAEVKSKKADLKIAGAGYQRALANMVYELKYSFTSLLWAQEMETLAEQILDHRTKNFGLVQLKYESGTEDKGSLMRVEADKEQAAYELEKARRSTKAAAIRLLKAMGSDESGDVTAAGAFGAAGKPPQSSLQELVEKTPEYQSAKLSYEKSEYQLMSARSGLYPDLSLSGGVSRNGAEWMPDRNGWNLGLSLSYNFFPGGRNIYNVKIAGSGKAESEQAFKETRQQLAVSINSALNSYIDAVNYVYVSEKYLKASVEQSRVTTTKYINGLSSYTDWYNVENDYINSMKSLLNSKRDAVLQEANFKKIIGEFEN